VTESVSALIERRTAQAVDGSFRRALAFAVALHAATALAAWAIPRWVSPRPQPLEYVAVTIVPAAKLGIEKPKPKPPAPKPEARPAESKPEPKPEPRREAPVAPTAKPRKAAAEPPPAPPAAEEEGSPLGAVAGLALGAPVARLDNPDFTYGYYVDQMLALISRNWIRPPVGGGIEAWIHYRIERDGRIVEVEILRSSGINSFDLAALRAVQSSSPLPPLPRAYREESLGVNLIVR